MTPTRPAHRTVAAIKARRAAGAGNRRAAGAANPQNSGSQRLLAIAEQGERCDRALWTPTAAATGGAPALPSEALVPLFLDEDGAGDAALNPAIPTAAMHRMIDLATATRHR